MTKPVDTSVCPLCQQQNYCGVNDTEACWCTKSKIPEQLLEQIPVALRQKACICQACVDKFNFELAKSAD